MNKLFILEIYLICIITVPFFEVIIKNYIRRKLSKSLPITINEGRIKIHYLKNNGMILGVGEKNRTLILIITIIGLVITVVSSLYCLLFIENYDILKVGLIILSSGALSNSLERFIYKYVIDYFSFPKVIFSKLRNVVFNFADLCIFAGVLLILIQLLISLLI